MESPPVNLTRIGGSIAIASVVLMVIKSSAVRSITKPLASVDQMALTNYLATSILLQFVSSGPVEAVRPVRVLPAVLCRVCCLDLQSRKLLDLAALFQLRPNGMAMAFPHILEDTTHSLPQCINWAEAVTTATRSWTS